MREGGAMGGRGTVGLTPIQRLIYDQHKASALVAEEEVCKSIVTMWMVLDKPALYT